MSTSDAVLQALRSQLADIILGTIFLSIGATACAIAAIRRRAGVRILVWWGVWSAMFGLQSLASADAVLAVLPRAMQAAAPYVEVTVEYLVLVAALLAWRELAVGRLRSLIGAEALAGAAIAVLGIVNFILGGAPNAWHLPNNLIAVVAALTLLVVFVVPGFSRFLVLPNSRVLTACTLVFAVGVLYTNLPTVLPIQYRIVPMLADFSFAALLFALGYVALEMVLANEHRLLAIETELEMARQIQASILPTRVPQPPGLRIAAAYRPMTSVAGDFYHFVQPDENRLGILVADVSGHGVPAALISSMIKVAMQPVSAAAHDPAQVLGGLNRILCSEAPGRIASAAYLWIDAERRTALYSAAGHPPLLCWRNHAGAFESIESNGLLFGIRPGAEYPVCSIRIAPGDRILLYTDGITETENAVGQAFGDGELERLVRAHHSQPAAELVRELLAGLDRWRPARLTQQDDMTLIVMDVV